LPVQHHRDLPAFGRDFVGIPFAARLRHRIDLHEVRDRSGAVGRVGALVENVDFVAGVVADLLRLAAPDEHAAVCVIACPKLHVQDEVFERLLAHEIIVGLRYLVVGDSRAVLEPPIALAEFVPVTHVSVVEQRDLGLLRASKRQQRTASARKPARL
jgi:hypothetical protein